MPQGISITDLISRIFGNYITNTIVLMLLAIFLFSVFAYFKNKIKNQSPSGFVQSAPTLLTTIGILGTFLGIFLGLLNFDVKNISESIPSLLEGLKLAFTTSIAGLFLSVLLKMIQFIFPYSQTATSGDITPRDIYNILSEIKEIDQNGIIKQENYFDNLRDAFDNLRSSISGEDDSSLVTQMIRLRTSYIDESREIKRTNEEGF